VGSDGPLRTRQAAGFGLADPQLFAVVVQERLNAQIL
jgi:hypothetical protein